MGAGGLGALVNETYCQDCFHGWADHSLEIGCFHGWEWDARGVAVTEGCRCKLAHTELSGHRG